MHWPLAVKCLLISAFFDFILNGVGSINIRYPKFYLDNETDFIRHNSYIVLNAIQVTPDVSGDNITNLAGRALYKKQFKLWRKKSGKVIRASFNSTFVLNIKPRTSPGGEGVAFVLTASSSLPENGQAKWLGIVNEDTNGTSQANIVAVEFDTKKSYPEDVDSNHVGLDVNSIYSRKQVSLSSLGVNLSAGTDVIVSVQYDGEFLSVFVGKNNKSRVFSEPIHLSDFLPQKVFVGFSAATSNYTQLNCVRSWEFNGSDVDEGPSLLWIKIMVPGVVLLTGTAFWFYWKWKCCRGQTKEVYLDIEEEIKHFSMAPMRFRIEELRKATGDFSSENMLGRGGFGKVYKGILHNREIAVKKLSERRTDGKQEFIAEIATIGNLNHKNLVKLIGWCCENSEFLLVYEYMPNGSLDRFIFSDNNSLPGTEDPILNWDRRLGIISGVAQALDYLHNGCEKKVLHRDIKASNVMLDSEFNAKLGDFGLALVVEQSKKTHYSTKEVAGTAGYMAPESFHSGRVTTETDVYAFGVLILEVVCGRKPGNQSHEQNDCENGIVHSVWKLHKMGRLLEAADQRLASEGYVNQEILCLLLLGLACCHPNPHQRPSVRTALQVLTGEADPPVVATEMPAFVWPAMPPSFKKSDCSLTGSQLTPFSDLSGR